jgi:hypothetical protein
MVPIALKLNCQSAHNSRILPEVQLHGIKREACYAASEIRMFKIIFFPGKINSEKYKPHIAQAFSANLSEGKREYVCFQDDCVTIRTSNNSNDSLSKICLGQIISRPQWSARSTVLTPRHYHLLRGTTINICRNKTHTQESTFKATVMCAVSATSKRYLKQF